MSKTDQRRESPDDEDDRAPGSSDDARTSPRAAIISYAIGLGLSALLTVASFKLLGSHLVWGPAIPVALGALAIAQIGVHLVFFLHLTSAPDNTNNALALAFGVLIVALIIAGSLWIMFHLNEHMLPMDQVMRMQR